MKKLILFGAFFFACLICAAAALYIGRIASQEEGNVSSPAAIDEQKIYSETAGHGENKQISPTIDPAGKKIFSNETLNFQISLTSEWKIVPKYCESVAKDGKQCDYRLLLTDSDETQKALLAYAAPSNYVPLGTDGFFGMLTWAEDYASLNDFCGLDFGPGSTCEVKMNPNNIPYVKLSGDFELGDRKSTVYLVSLKATDPEWKLIALSTRDFPGAESSLQVIVDSFAYLHP